MKSSATAFDRVVSVVLTLAVVVLTSAYVRRTFSPQSRLNKPVVALSYEESWEKLLEVGRLRGDPNAPIDLVEFADFECPFCRSFDRIVQDLEARYGGRLRRAFVHTPIPGHRFAYHAARMAECAGDQGRFWQMHDALFARQDSFGLRPWGTFAEDADIPDLSAFQRCASRSDTVSAIEEGLRAANAFKVTGTPTVLLNGWRLAVAPQEDSVLSHLIDQLLSDKTELEVVGQRFKRRMARTP